MHMYAYVCIYWKDGDNIAPATPLTAFLGKSVYFPFCLLFSTLQQEDRIPLLRKKRDEHLLMNFYCQ